MKKFDVVIRYKGKNIAYQNLTGERAIKTMEELKKRGFNPVAVTNANGITEQLNLKEMKQTIIF